MAIIHRINPSEVGAETGNDGNTGYNLLFSVRAETGDLIPRPDGNDGFLSPVYPDPMALLANSLQARLGDPHPHNPDVRAYSYSYVERRAPGYYIVRVNYRDDSIEPTADGEWLVSLRGLSVPRRLIEELPESEGGLDAVPAPRRLPGGSLRATPIGDATSEPLKLIGPKKYEKVLGPGANFSSTETVPNKETGLATDQEVFLWPTSGRVVEGYDSEWPAMAVTFRRIAANFTIDRAGQLIVQYMKACNRSEFRGAPPGHVKVDGLSIDPIEKTVAGQTRQGRAWRIEVVFHWSAIPWTPHEITPSHTSEDGAKRPIVDRDGNRVIERRRVRRTQDLEGLLSVLGVG